MKKYVAATTGATHAEQDATFFEAINPFGPPVDTTAGLMRAAAVAGVTWVACNKVKTGNFGF